MARLYSDNVNGIRNFGEYGDASIANDGKTLAAAQINDTVDLFQIGGQSCILDGHVFAAALGASAAVSIGWRYADGSAGGSATAMLSATVMNTSNLKTQTAHAPFVVDKDIIVYATITGAVATGRIDVVVVYRPQGTK